MLKRTLQAINRTDPGVPGYRNDQCFRFVRALLKYVPELHRHLFPVWVPFFDLWFTKCYDGIGTKNYYVALSDFRRGCEDVQVPLGEGLMGEMVERARALPVPACVADRRSPRQLKLLARVCLALQEYHGEGKEFPLACRTAGDCVGRSGKTAYKYLVRLVAMGFLEVAREGHALLVATRYRVVQGQGRCI